MSELLIQNQLPSGWQKASSPGTCRAMSKHTAEDEVCMRGGSQHVPALCSAWALPSPVPTALGWQRRAVTRTACSLPVPWAVWGGSNVPELEDDNAQFVATRSTLSTIECHLLAGTPLPPSTSQSGKQRIGHGCQQHPCCISYPALGSTVCITACTPPAARHTLSWAAKSFPDCLFLSY